MASFSLTTAQSRVLDYIKQHIAKHTVPPTRAEIASALGFKSPNGAEEHLQALARKGAISLISGTSRGIRLNGLEADHETASGLLDTIEWPSSQEAFFPLPLVGRVAAGAPILAQQHIDEIRSLPVSLFDRKPHFLLKVKGMSMQNAGILEGDLLAIRAQSVAQNGQIIVARIDDEVTVKRYHRDAQGHIQLKAENPDYDDILIPKGCEFQIEGVMVGLIRASI